MSLRDLILTVQQGLTGGDTGTLIVLAVLLLVIVLAGLLIAFAVYSRTPRARIDALLEERTEGKDSSRWITRVIPLLIIVAAIALFEIQGGKPEQCVRCHTEVIWSETLSQTAHAGQDCLSCHGATGVAQVAADVTKYVRWIVVYTAEKGVPDLTAGSVSPDACLKCHSSVLKGTAERYGIRVRHKDFLDVGYGCRDCHNSTAHGEAVKQPTEPQMSKCIVCHDGVAAPNECEYCHAQDPIQVASEGRDLPKRNDLNSKNCYACHDETPCITCHGVTMPHPEGWSDEAGRTGEGGEFHARKGFANRELCWRCHFSNNKPFVRPETRGAFDQTDDGCTCHGSFGEMHGGAAWVAEHGLQATGQKTGELSDCYTCHDARYFCAMCHDKTMAQRYKPQPGPDNYRRDIARPQGYFEY